MGTEGKERNLALTLECVSADVQDVWPVDYQWPMSFIQVACTMTIKKYKKQTRSSEVPRYVWNKLSIVPVLF